MRRHGRCRPAAPSTAQVHRRSTMPAFAHAQAAASPARGGPARVSDARSPAVRRRARVTRGMLIALMATLVTPAAARAADDALAQRITRSAGAHTTALARIGGTPRRPPRGRAAQLARRWNDVYRAAAADEHDILAIVPATRSGALSKTCAL